MFSVRHFAYSVFYFDEAIIATFIRLPILQQKMPQYAR